jgi:hypothetical protein
VNVARLDALQEPREPDRETRGHDPPIRFALAHPETGRTEHEHRAARDPREETATLDLDEMPKNTDEQLAALHAQRPETLEKRVVREMRELHESFIHPRFSCPDSATSGPCSASIASRDLARVNRSRRPANADDDRSPPPLAPLLGLRRSERVKQEMRKRRVRDERGRLIVDVTAKNVVVSARAARVRRAAPRLCETPRVARHPQARGAVAARHLLPLQLSGGAAGRHHLTFVEPDWRGTVGAPCGGEARLPRAKKSSELAPRPQRLSVSGKPKTCDAANGGPGRRCR